VKFTPVGLPEVEMGRILVFKVELLGSDSP